MGRRHGAWRGSALATAGLRLPRASSPVSCPIACPTPCSTSCPMPCSLSCPISCPIYCPMCYLMPCPISCPMLCPLFHPTSCPTSCPVSGPTPCLLSCLNYCPMCYPTSCCISCPLSCLMLCPKSHPTSRWAEPMPLAPSQVPVTENTPPTARVPPSSMWDAPGPDLGPVLHVGPPGPPWVWAGAGGCCPPQLLGRAGRLLNKLIRSGCWRLAAEREPHCQAAGVVKKLIQLSFPSKLIRPQSATQGAAAVAAQSQGQNVGGGGGGRGERGGRRMRWWWGAGWGTLAFPGQGRGQSWGRPPASLWVLGCRCG